MNNKYYIYFQSPNYLTIKIIETNYEKLFTIFFSISGGDPFPSGAYFTNGWIVNNN